MRKMALIMAILILFGFFGCINAPRGLTPQQFEELEEYLQRRERILRRAGDAPMYKNEAERELRKGVAVDPNGK